MITYSIHASALVERWHIAGVFMNALFRRFVLLSLLVLTGLPNAYAVTALPVDTPVLNTQETVNVAGTISTITGAAISPLLVGGGHGAFRYYTTKPELREKLPWTASPWFWGPLLTLGLLFLFNGTIGRLIPFLARSMDAIESLEGKFALLYASPLVLSIAMTLINTLEKSRMVVALEPVVSGFHRVALNSVTISSPGLLDWLLYTVILLTALFIFLVVWLLSQTVNTLVLICPVPVLGSVLKFLQYGVLILLMVMTAISPWLGLLVALPIILFAMIVAGWCFRFTVFGTVLAWDLVLFRRRKSSLQPIAFSDDINVLPARTLGRVSRTAEGRLEFNYRPWLILPMRSISIVCPIYLKRNLLCPQLQTTINGKQFDPVLFNLPPRYRGAEDALASGLGLADIREGALLRGWSACAAWLGQVFRRKTPMESAPK